MRRNSLSSFAYLFLMKMPFVLTILFSFLAVLACVPSGVRPVSPGDLAETVSTFYELKKQGKFDAAWRLERMSIDSDEKRRESSRKTYVSRSAGGMQLKDYEILEIGREGSGTDGLTPARVKLVTEWPVLPFPVPEGDRVTVMEDLWEKIDGRWYHVVRGITKLW